MKKLSLILAFAAVTGLASAQKKTTTSATIAFDATTEKDDNAKAENKTAIAAIDTKTGTVAFEAIVKSFNFTNEMMQEHFNGPKWLDSDKFPKSTFKGKVTNISEVNFEKDGSYKANVEGDLTIHGITKPVKTTATVNVKDKALNTSANFSIKLADYGITSAGGKLAEETKISVSADFK